jgi:RNA polymerase sigma-70 factor (ECF subfamily)
LNQGKGERAELLVGLNKKGEFLADWRKSTSHVIMECDSAPAVVEVSRMSDYPMGTKSSDSALLFAQCTSGDVALQAQAYQTLWAYLFRIALQLVRDQADADALAQDCAQAALLQIHTRITECREPKAFRSWAKRIVSNLCIDELRRRSRRHFVDEEPEDVYSEEVQSGNSTRVAESPETIVIDWDSANSIRQGLRQAPISERSYRTIVARYIDDIPDEELAKSESEGTGQRLLPSHLQVTRAKNLSKLRKWEALSTLLGAL